MENEEQVVNEEETKQEIVQEEKLTIKTVFSDIGIGVKYIFSFKMLLYLIIVILFVNFFFAPLTSNFLPYFIASDVAVLNIYLKTLCNLKCGTPLFQYQLALV